VIAIIYIIYSLIFRHVPIKRKQEKAAIKAGKAMQGRMRTLAHSDVFGDVF
jgi:hypothetical protein